MSQNQLVAILGASPKEDRFAYKAQRLLKEMGYPVAPVNPAFKEILGDKVFPDFSSLLGVHPHGPHTITVYMNAQRSSLIEKDILASKAKRVIFNPGAENLDLETKLRRLGVEPVRACTLILLRSGDF